MPRLCLHSLMIALGAGLVGGLWMVVSPAFAWHPLIGAGLGGAVVAGAVAGLSRWGGAAGRWQWNDLHDRQDRLNHRQQELECHVKLLELERQRLESVFDVLGEAVLVTGNDETVRLANEAAARLLDFELPTARRSSVDELVRDPRLLQLIRDVRESSDGTCQRHIEYRRTEDGHVTVFDLTLRGMTDNDAAAGEGGGVDGVVAILRDVTRQRCVAEMHSDFVSSVSHELRTPLSSIKAYIEMLVDGEAQDEPTRQEFYAIIQAETNRLTRLIDNILNISRIEAGLVRVQSEVVDLYALTAEAVDLIDPQARAANLTVQGPAKGPACRVIADRDMLLQAILNLLGNAVKYTPGGGRIEVYLRESAKAETVELCVRDTGVGIPETDVPFIFDKFYRVPEHKQLAKGTGLGLNLVKHVVETVHGGKLSVASRLGEGSTFTFRLSMADSMKGGTPASEADHSLCSTADSPVSSLPDVAEKDVL